MAAVIVGITSCHAFAPPMSAIESPHGRTTAIPHPSSRTGLHESSDPESLKQEMLRNPSQSKDILMYQMYEEWRAKYSKKSKAEDNGEVDPNRFMEFKRNYLQMQKRYEQKVALARRDRKDPPPPLTLDELNEYADLTIAEYHRLVRGGGDPPFQEPSTGSSASPSKTKSSTPPKKVKPRTSLAPRASPTTAVSLNPQETTTTSMSSLSSPPAPEPSTTKARAAPTPPKKKRSPTRREKKEDGWKQAMLQNPSQSKDIMIYQLYQEWQQKYKKGGGDDTNDDADNNDGSANPTTTNRFMEFKSNYMRLKQQHEQAVALAKMEQREPPPFPEITEFADLTPSEYHRRTLQQQQQQQQELQAKENENENEKSSAISLTSDEASSTPANMGDTNLQEPPIPKKTDAPSGTASIKQQAVSQSIIPDRKEEPVTVTPKKVVSVNRGTTRPPYTSKNKTNAPTDDLKQAMLKNPSQSKDIMIYQVYEDWRMKYNKGEFDKHRFMEFKTNYMRMQQNHQRLVAIAAMDRQPAPPPPEINEYADMTKAEYHRLLKAKQDQEEKEGSSEIEETKEAPQVIVWGPEGDLSSGRKKVEGIRKPYVGRTKHATKAMPPIRVKARSLDGVAQEAGSVTQGEQRRRSTQGPSSIRPDEQEIRRQTSQSLTRRSAISTGSSPISVDRRGQNADQMAVDFPELNSLPARGGPRRPGISDQETRVPLKTVDPSSSYAAHNKVDLKKMPDVPGVSDQETKLPPRRVNTDYYTQGPKMINDDDDAATVSERMYGAPSIMGAKSSISYSSTGTGVASDQDTKLPPKRVSTDYFTQAPNKPDVERTAPGVSDQETRSPASNLDPSGFYAADNKHDLRRMAAVPHKGSSGSLSRQRIDSTAPYPRDMVRARISVSDQERRVPSELLDTGSYSPARDYPSRFSAMQGTLRSFGGKRSFRVTPESLSEELPESDEEPSKPTPVAADQKARAPSNRINPDSIHAAHWPL